jgi:hypothetical protein
MQQGVTVQFRGGVTDQFRDAVLFGSGGRYCSVRGMELFGAP